MANRHQRRKAAKAKAEAQAEAKEQWAQSARVQAIVRMNKAKPIERSYYDSKSPLADVKANIFEGYREPRAGGGMDRKRVDALKVSGKQFSRASDLSDNSYPVSDSTHRAMRGIWKQIKGDA